jgi:hypothetical protein
VFELENVAPPILADTVPLELVDQPVFSGAVPIPELAVFGKGTL